MMIESGGGAQYLVSPVRKAPARNEIGSAGMFGRWLDSTPMLTPNTNDELTYLLSSPNELSPYVAANVSSYDQKSVQEQTVISPSIFSPVDKSKQYRKRTSLDFYNQSSNFVPSTCEAKSDYGPEVFENGHQSSSSVLSNNRLLNSYGDQQFLSLLCSNTPVQSPLKQLPYSSTYRSSSSGPLTVDLDMIVPDSDVESSPLGSSTTSSVDRGINIKKITSSSALNSKTSPEANVSREIRADYATPKAVLDEFPKCNCKKSKCVKLYCECFAAMRLCDNCLCVDCHSDGKHEDIRLSAVRSTKERNGSAFQLKVSSTKVHSTGCNCKRSQCLKKYCECFQGGSFCGANCKCNSCQNFEGSTSILTSNHTHNFADTEELKRKAPLKMNSSPDELYPSGGEIEPLPLQSNAIVKSALKGTGKLPGKFPNVPFENFAVPVMRMSTRSGGRQRGALVEYSPAPISNNQFPNSSPCGIDELISPMLMQLVSTPSAKSSQPLKKRKVKFAQAPILYPFFGPNLPLTSKVVALHCLEYLDGKNLYSLSLVNSLWNSVVMDDALWE